TTADDQYLETPPGAGYEHTDANVSAMVKFAVWLFISAVVVHLGLALMYSLLIRQANETAGPAEYPLAVDQSLRLPPPPTLQQFQRRELSDFRAKEEAALHSYGWVDKSAGTVHIPIQDAMRLTLERGLPTRPQEGSAASAPAGLMPSDSSSGRVLEKRRE